MEEKAQCTGNHRGACSQQIQRCSARDQNTARFGVDQVEGWIPVSCRCVTLYHYQCSHLLTTIITDHLLLAGVSFVKDDIISALSIGHSAAGTDAKLFSSEVLQKIDAVKEWVGEPDGPAGERYSSMTVASFRKYVDGKLSEPSYGHNHKRKREAPKSKKVNLKGKNKCVEVTPESSEEEGSSSSDVVPTRRIRKRTAMGSEELDE